MSPLCESFLSAEQLDHMEPFYPLVAEVCERCFLVQVQEYVSPDHIFNEYAYYSSFSRSWVEHARAYVEEMIPRFQLTTGSRIVELASNDGYLLQHFVERGIPVLGVEPAGNVAEVAIAKGIPTATMFFGTRTCAEVAAGGQADLLLGNNVLAQVPDLNDFVAGMKQLLADHGVITLEFPHLLRLIDDHQFDTIYHEHFSYFSLQTVQRIMAKHRLTVFDVDELPTHGGSLRVYIRHSEDTSHAVEARVQKLIAREALAGLARMETYTNFGQGVVETKRALMRFLFAAKRRGQSVAGYGAPGKGNTLLNYCGIRTDCLDYTVDLNPYKQGKFLPGTHIPIFEPDRLALTKPDLILILPWNLEKEIIDQLTYARAWGARFIVPIPRLRIV
jgi:2-polyprenyl-3-methyl-5-hydroxy-6-metoxy-1,4-benzoquinol methylase